MKSIVLALLAINLTGCAYYEGQRVLNDPDCSFIGKDINWRWPAKCGVLPSGETIYIRQTGPNTFHITK